MVEGGGAGRQKAFNMGVVLLEGALRFKTVLVYIWKRG